MGAILTTNKEKRKQTSFRINSELLISFRHAVIDRGKSMNSVIEELIGSWVSESKTVRGRARKLDLPELFLRSLAAAAVVKDLDGSIQWANPQYERLTGKTLVGLIRKKISDIWPAEYARKIEKHDLHVVKGKAPIAALETVPVGGKEYVRFTIRFPIFDEKGHILLTGAFGCYWNEVLLAELKAGRPIKLAAGEEVSISRRRRK
jgi:PAS domain S-box-containing protein